MTRPVLLSRVAPRHVREAPRPRLRAAGSLLLVLAAAASAKAQLVHGTISSSVGSGRVAGAVVLLLDSTLTAHARALSSDSGTFAIGPGAPGRFHLKVMRIGFKPTESATFDLRRDTSIDLALADIPVVLPALVMHDRNDCRLHPDTSESGLATFALWDQARTALLATAITLEQQDYRFTKLLHLRVYDVRQRALRDIALRETVTHGSAPWTSLPVEQLRRTGSMAQADSGLTFYAPDLDVLLSPYFTEDHCFHLAATAPPDSDLVGLDFEPAARSRHVEIRGTLWLDRVSKELRRLRFAFVNLPDLGSDTLVGGNLDFARLTTGAWILPSWSIRMPTPVRNGMLESFSSGFGPGTTIRRRGRWRISTDFIRVVGGDVRVVRRGDADDVLWRRPTGGARITAFVATDTGPAAALGAFIRLAGSPYGGHADVQGRVRFEQVVPGVYLFEATTPLHDVVEAPAERAVVTVRAGELVDALVRLKPLVKAAAEVCGVSQLDRNSGVLAGRVLHGDDPVGRVRVSLQWVGGDPTMETREDGYFRFCNVPVGTLILVRASHEKLMVTTTVTLAPNEIVHPLELKLQP